LRSARVAAPLAVGACALLAGLVTPRDAFAFCRTSVCEFGVLGSRCTPARDGDCGVPLTWKERCIGFSMQRDGTSLLSAEEAGELVAQAFTSWNAADCAGKSPQFYVKRQPDAVCASLEYNVDRNVNKGNANVVIFREDAWPYPDFEGGLAFTTLTYDLETGEIYDADIEINTFDIVFTTSDSDIAYDLASTLQHETGHFLGLSHAPDPASPMFATPEFGARRRELTPDDAAAVCDAYPPEEPALTWQCSPMPHDFSPLCNETLPAATAEEDGACSMSSSRGRNGAAPLLAMLIALCTLRRRRRRPERAHAHPARQPQR
jgi:hypothetical protein